MLLAKNIMSFRLVDNFMVYLLLHLVDFVYLITINSFLSVFLWVCGLLWSKICCSSNNDPSWPSHVSSTSRLTLNDKFQCLLVFFIMELCTQIWTSNQGELGIRQYTEGGHIWWVFLESVPVVLFFSYYTTGLVNCAHWIISRAFPYFCWWFKFWSEWCNSLCLFLSISLLFVSP